MQSRLNLLIAEGREFVAPEHGPLKKLNKRAIKIADSHGGDSSVWYYRIDATGALAEHVVL